MTPWPDNPVLVEVWRSGFLESVHRGALVVLGADGEVLAAAGDVDRPILPRSSNKPLQAAALLAAGWSPCSVEETALGAASHVGNREIAEYLLSKGARPSIFSAAMLGQLDVVKAFVAAQPGVQKTWGPHGITLLAHAEAGGDRAKAVLDYLTTLGDANERPDLKPLTAEEMKALAGTYAFG